MTKKKQQKINELEVKFTDLTPGNNTMTKRDPMTHTAGYKIPTFHSSGMRVNESEPGEPIEIILAKRMESGESLEDLHEAPIIYTEKADGVLPAYNIRTDRFELALEGINQIQRSKTAQRDANLKKVEDNDSNNDGKNSTSQNQETGDKAS